VVLVMVLLMVAMVVLLLVVMGGNGVGNGGDGASFWVCMGWVSKTISWVCSEIACEKIEKGWVG